MHYRKSTPYLFIMPMLIGLILFRFGPILASLLISFTEWRGTTAPEFIGFGNYSELLNKKDFWEVLGNTMIFAALFVPGVMILGLALAVLVNQNLRGIAFFRGMYYLPAITAMVAVALVWNWIFATRFGILNHILRTYFSVRQPPAWLADENTALLVLVIVSIWKSAGLQMLIFLAGLKGIPEYLYDAARIDGANRLQQFRHVTLPMLTPVTFFVLIISIFEAFRTFEVTYVMTGGGPLHKSATLSYYIYENAFQFFRFGFSSAIAYVLMVVVIIITIINFRIRGSWVSQDVY